MGLNTPQKANDGPIQVFISYSTENKKMAAEIKRGLEQLGFDCFLAHEDLPAGTWRDNLDKALETFDVFLPILTDEAKDSAWVQQESGIAHSRKRKGKGKPLSILPLTSDYDPPGCISIYQGHKLKFGAILGGLKFVDSDVLAISQKFVEELQEQDRARKYALQELPRASTQQASLILDFALWARVPFDDAKFIIECTSRNHNLTQSEDVFNSIYSIYTYEPFKVYFDEDPKMADYLKKYLQSVTKRREEEERQRRESMKAFNEMMKDAANNLKEQSENIRATQQAATQKPEKPE